MRLEPRLLQLGHASLWDFLRAHEGKTWADLGAVLGVPPREIIRALADAAPSRDWAVRELLYREILEFFPDGWDPGPDAWQRHAHVAGGMASGLGLTKVAIRDCLTRLYETRRGWIPSGPNDEELRKATEGLFGVIPQSSDMQ